MSPLHKSLYFHINRHNLLFHVTFFLFIYAIQRNLIQVQKTIHLVQCHPNLLWIISLVLWKFIYYLDTCMLSFCSIACILLSLLTHRHDCGRFIKFTWKSFSYGNQFFSIENKLLQFSYNNTYFVCVCVCIRVIVVICVCVYTSQYHHHISSVNLAEENMIMFSIYQ